jgi:hypothetical protein
VLWEPKPGPEDYRLGLYARLVPLPQGLRDRYGALWPSPSTSSKPVTDAELADLFRAVDEAIVRLKDDNELDVDVVDWTRGAMRQALVVGGPFVSLQVLMILWVLLVR